MAREDILDRWDDVQSPQRSSTKLIYLWGRASGDPDQSSGVIRTDIRCGKFLLEVWSGPRIADILNGNGRKEQELRVRGGKYARLL